MFQTQVYENKNIENKNIETHSQRIKREKLEAADKKASELNKLSKEI
jgi:hypothetical protein